MTIRAQNDDWTVHFTNHNFRNILFPEGCPNLDHMIFRLNERGKGDITFKTCYPNVKYYIREEFGDSTKIRGDGNQVDWISINTFEGMLDNIPEKVMVVVLPMLYAMARTQGVPLFRDK